MVAKETIKQHGIQLKNSKYNPLEMIEQIEHMKTTFSCQKDNLMDDIVVNHNSLAQKGLSRYPDAMSWLKLKAKKLDNRL